MNDHNERILHGEVVSLRDYFERVIEETNEKVILALAAADKAVNKAEIAQERRLDLLNEFRAQASDESRKYALKDSTEDRLSKIETSVARLYGGLVMLSFIGIANLVKIWTG